jgi:hypothetical protein
VDYGVYVAGGIPPPICLCGVQKEKTLPCFYCVLGQHYKLSSKHHEKLSFIHFF